jgi:hypothetical protein
VSDHLREAGVIVAHLSRALLDGSRDLSTVPSLIKRVIAEGMWRQRADPASGQKIPERPFRSFHEFACTPASKGGLGSSIPQLRGLCEGDIDARNALDKVTQRSPGGDRRSADFNVDNVHVERPAGNSESAALRRLRKDAPELHAEVLAGNLKAHAAMVRAGFRSHQLTIRADSPESAARTLCRYMQPGDLAELVRLLSSGRPPE